MDELKFAELRQANTERIPKFKNARGELAHKPDGSDWLLSQWCNATCGELGETANLIKKIERGDFSLDETREELGKELADVAIYLDLLSFRAGIDLGEAVRNKFNEVSRRVDCDVFLSCGEQDKVKLKVGDHAQVVKSGPNDVYAPILNTTGTIVELIEGLAHLQTRTGRRFTVLIDCLEEYKYWAGY